MILKSIFEEPFVRSFFFAFSFSCSRFSSLKNFVDEDVKTLLLPFACVCDCSGSM